jgi:hypothetical protein
MNIWHHRLILLIVAILFQLALVGQVYSQDGYVTRMNCDGAPPFETPCYATEVGSRANINFHVEYYGFFDTFIDYYYWTEATCPNGVTVSNTSEVGDAFYAAYGISTAHEMRNFNTIWQTDPLVPVLFWSTGIITPGIEHSYYELCYPGGVGIVTGGCNQPANPDGSCSTGFVNSGGTCTRSSSFQNQCIRFGEYDTDTCACAGGCWDGGGCSPVVVDVLGNGFSLTSAPNGVSFDLRNSGTPQTLSWTSADSDDALLAFDRNGNGMIDNGRELFGNATPQMPPEKGESLNGFRALALYDGFGYGGNGDGLITGQDAIFNRLKLWQDKNHNGISESCEMFTLPQLGLSEIDLSYRSSRRIDQFGNEFRYRSKVLGSDGSQLGRWAWDVFLVIQQ